jgi:hypothetical protein
MKTFLPIDNERRPQRTGLFHPGLCIRYILPRPPHKVLKGGRAVPGEIAFRKPPRGFFLSGGLDIRDPFVEPDKCLLLSPRDPETDLPGKPDGRKMVIPPLSNRGYACVFSRPEQLIAGKLLPAVKFIRDDLPAFGKVRFGKPELPVTPRTPGNNPECNKGKDPRTSSGATRWLVPRKSQVRIFFRSTMASCIPDMVAAGMRSPTYQRAP